MGESPPNSERLFLRTEMTVECEVLRPGAGRCRGMIVALHGWGQQARFFARGLRPVAAAGYTVVCPQAPHPFYVDRERGRVGFTWLTRHERDRATTDINQYLLHVLQELGAPDAHFLGFSQGSSVAWRFLAAFPEAVKGVISCCADLPPDVAAKLDGLPPVPALIAYSPGDEVVPPAVSRLAHDTLLRAGWPADVALFDGGHRIAPALASHVVEWLGQRTPPQP